MAGDAQGTDAAADGAAQQPDGAGAPRADRRSWVRRHGPETLIGAVAVTIVGAVVSSVLGVLLPGEDDGKAAAVPSASPASPASPACGGETCRGLDPKESRCDDARTLAEGEAGVMRVEVRHSKECKAVWGKLTGARPGDPVTVSTSPADRQRAEVATGRTKYTPMLPVGDTFDVQVCAVSRAGDPEGGVPKGAEPCAGADQDDLARVVGAG
ncbi:DUF2690 domain-containing protein [Streptomyces sp. NPDC059506]|uniref:DUF2690 domain-containing protein n=1 Tax=unclassified Streptomyces TaxID=2593676 RepID=UPI000CACC257|nr:MULTISPECIES: DUF2690 domain-containing protein [unclassified Streptomyces]MCZ2524733.1 DUF2690 domain-containing protein [Streptomyces sp. HB2AG]PLW65816.1 hypothetical protein C0036_26075 [Streptomyces sp. DJ]QMV22452.1 DUF2690 domain-containing protein [Streptomyces sp. SCUT-3]